MLQKLVVLVRLTVVLICNITFLLLTKRCDDVIICAEAIFGICLLIMSKECCSLDNQI